MSFSPFLPPLAMVALALPWSVQASVGKVEIQVVDEQGQRIPNAAIVLWSKDSLTSHATVTDDRGMARLTSLTPSRHYQVEISKAGFQTIRYTDITIISGKQFTVNYTLPKLDQSLDVIEVVARQNPLALDTRSPTVSTEITLDITDSLPTGRSYQSYLQLVPGVGPSASGNPASRSGVNYATIGGLTGVSSDNVYLLDGINVTDNETGGFGAQINSEIIQEQRVLTGGIPAEYEGGSGLISQVISKSGGNEFHGSVNYYFQDDSLVQDNQHLPENAFSNYDTAVTLGGPLIRDKLWFFTSYQRKSAKKRITDAANNHPLRTITEDSDLLFAKLSWEPVDHSRVQLVYFGDPTTLSGSGDPSVPNNRDLIKKTGGDNVKLEYGRHWDDLLLTLSAAHHQGEASVLPVDGTPSNNLAYRQKQEISHHNLHKGGHGIHLNQHRNNTEYRADLEYFLDTLNWGSHTLKGGYKYTENLNKMDDRLSTGLAFMSIGAQHGGTTLAEYTGPGWVGDISLTEDDYPLILDALRRSDQHQALLATLDSNRDGHVSRTELGDGVIFDTSEGNPSGDINVYRRQQNSPKTIRLKVKGHALYLQDSIELADWTVSAGMRAEKWTHHASDGSETATFGWDLAPRLSVSWDLAGDGQQKLWGFWGRYYDPARTNMTYFTGNLTGPILHEQIYLGGDWLTYRVRGDSEIQHAVFAPNIRTPYTDELLLGYARQLGENMGLEITFTQRETRDLIEDYNLALYADDLAGTAFHLPYTHFGFDQRPNSRYVIANLEGGKREYQGVEVVFRKHLRSGLKLQAAYTYNDQQGNSITDSNADFQGDFVWLDPRAPNMWGPLPGSIDHIFKAFATYEFGNGLELGAVFRWNSGTHYNKTWTFARRHLPVLSDSPYQVGGINGRWAQSASASYTTPAYGILDLRLKYTHEFAQHQVELFLDIFNLLDKQAAHREQDLAAGDGTYDFGQANGWEPPRRFYLGARISF